MSEVQASIRIRIEDDEELMAAQDLAAASDVEMEASSAPPAGGVEGQEPVITAVLIAAGVTLVAKFVSDWIEKRRGGLVLDQRADAEDDIYRRRDVPYGYILIYPADGGSVRIETRDMPKDAMHQLLESVIAGAFESVTDLAKAAADALGKDRVEVAPT